MRKLKRKSDNKVFDCTILLDVDGYTMLAAYWDGKLWKLENLDIFVPAMPGVDY